MCKAPSESSTVTHKAVIIIDKNTEAFEDVKNSCCCCSLKLGSIVVGTISVIEGVVALLMLLQRISEEHPTAVTDYRYARLYDLDQKTYGAVGIVASFQVVLGTLLMIGAEGGCHQFVRPWLLFSYFKLLMDFTSFIKFGVDSLSVANFLYMFIYKLITDEFILSSIGLVFVAGLELSYMIVVYKFHKQLKQQEVTDPPEETV